MVVILVSKSKSIIKSFRGLNALLQYVVDNLPHGIYRVYCGRTRQAKFLIYNAQGLFFKNNGAKVKLDVSFIEKFINDEKHNEIKPVPQVK